MNRPLLFALQFKIVVCASKTNIIFLMISGGHIVLRVKLCIETKLVPNFFVRQCNVVVEHFCRFGESVKVIFLV